MKKIFFFFFILCMEKNLLAQNVGIGTTSPAPSAQLDVTSNTKGLLIPRMTGLQRTSIGSPTAGLLVYQTNTEVFPPSSPGFYLYESGGWKRIARADEISGGTSTWTVSGSNQYSNVAGSVGIGTSSPDPSALLDVASITKGFLPPKMTTTQRNAIGSPTAGLLVFDNTLKEFYHYDGGSWRAILNSKYDYWNKSATRSWVYNNTDSIGLGTTSPDEKLHIVNGKIYIQDNRTNENPQVIFDVPSVDGNEAGLQFKRSGDTLAAINYIADGTDPNYIRIGMSSAGKHNDFTINTNGEIGLGTHLPYGQMQLSAYTGDNLLINDADGTIQFSAPTFGVPIKKGFVQLTNGDDLRLGTNSSNNTGKIIFRTNNTDHIAIDQDGEIGVGTMAPGARLHILSGADAGLTLAENGYIMLGNPSGGTNLVLDKNEIMVREGALLPGTLNIQHDGGEVTIGARTTINKSGESLRIDGTNTAINFYQAGVFKSFINHTASGLYIGVNDGNIRLDVSNGHVAIGTVVLSGPDKDAYKLAVNGNIVCQELKVKLNTNWPDYVFSKNYKLPSLQELDMFIKANNHLPNIPAAIEIEKNGLEVGDMQKRMMEKIEEMTLYIIDLQKQLDELKRSSAK